MVNSECLFGQHRYTAGEAEMEGKASDKRKITVVNREELMNTPVLKKPVLQLGSMSFSFD